MFRNNAAIDIKLSAIEVFAKHAFGAFLIRQLYFNSKFQFKLSTKVILGLTVLINALLIIRYVDLTAKGSKWWAAIVLNDIVLYFVIFLQMLFEWRSWPNKLVKWREDLFFDQQFRNHSDQSENFIRTNVNSMIENLVEEVDDIANVNPKILDEKLPLEDEEDMSIVKKKDLKLAGTIYSTSYVAFMREHKKKFRMSENDQFDLLWRAMLILAVQIFFIACILMVTKVKLVVFNNTPLQVCLFFTTLLLHFGCIPGARSGLYMMKYAVTHADKFTHPRVAFLLGFIQFTTMVVSELINIMKGSERKKPQDLITSYIGFACIINIPTIYLSSINHIPIKGAVSKLTLTRGRKQVKEEFQMPGHFLFNAIYVLFKWFYNSFYFYFFTFVVIIAPMVSVLVAKEAAEAK